MDIGLGIGQIGTFTKQVLPEIELNGVEIYLPYIIHPRTPCKLYKRIIIADVLEMYNKLWNVDLVIAFDVIEHLDRKEGTKLIKYFRSICNKSLLVSVPIIDYPQGECYGNIHETHLTQWKVKEMEDIGGKLIYEGKTCGLFEFTPDMFPWFYEKQLEYLKLQKE